MSEITVYDNGGKTIDRYTVVIAQHVWTMSEHPRSPQGFCQYAGEVSQLSCEEGEEIPLKELPMEPLHVILEFAAVEVIERMLLDPQGECYWELLNDLLEAEI